MKQKTVSDIDNWFESECKNALAEIPTRVKEMAKESKGYTLVIAESIARKKSFRIPAVLKYLQTQNYPQ